MLARRWDVPGAKDMLLQTVKWWKDNNMDEIHTEDWSSVAKEYPINTDGVDRNGQPVFVFSIGDWDLRRAALQGKLDLAIRHFIKGFDEVHVKSIEYNKSGKSNGTQWNFISNLDKLSRQQHLCIPCLRFYTGIMLMFESHYPGSTEKIFVINAPSIFSVILTLVQPILSPETYKALQILGTNKEQWGPILFSHIAKDQLPESVGGSRT
ncbi:hypothetical protein Fcan01_16399 [Folsomia candida]|uniref:CRAL-TRIO domain-containing protein n=1 Tax=Folsomia candida TaxID=158441 RepID=A0A226DVE7_FOLCA|nr:hypothetical protein Fcan01_16399 [Folsomia candida]